MTVHLTSPVLGQEVGAAYTGPLESWLLHEGYATTAAAVPDAWVADDDGVLGAKAPAVTITPTAAVLNATVNAVNQSGAGTIVFGTEGGVRTTVTLASADTPAAAAAKIDTALAGLADAAIVSSKLRVTSIATGPTAYVTVVGGTAAVLADLKVAVGDIAYGGDGRPAGASNLGAQADVPANDPTSADNREDTHWAVEAESKIHWSIANDADNLNDTSTPNPDLVDFDPAGVDDDAPVKLTGPTPATGDEDGGTVVTFTGHQSTFEGISGVKFGSTDGTAFDLSDPDEDGIMTVTVTTPVHAPGVVSVTLVDVAGGDLVIASAFTFVASP